MLWPVLAWCAFWNLWNIYFFNFPNFFHTTVNRGYGGSPVHVGSRKLVSLYLIIWISNCIIKIVVLHARCVLATCEWHTEANACVVEIHCQKFP
jgi:hypothetical protein